MKASASVTLCALFCFAALQIASAHPEEPLEHDAAVCPLPMRAGSSLLQHAKSHSAEGEHVHEASQLAIAQTNWAHAAGRAGHRSEEGGPGPDQSIFMIRMKDLDTKAFYVIFSVMIFFTIAVDRLQGWLAKHARASPVETRLLRRVNAELMMFGCVAVSIFVFTNLFSNIPEQWTLYMTFADIFASIAAVSMIFVTLMLYSMKSLLLPLLASFEIAIIEERGSQGMSKQRSKESAKLSRMKSITFSSLGQMEYEVMITDFARKHSIPKEIMYVDYLSECLVGNACDIMDLHWSSWVVVLVFSLVAICLRWLREKTRFDEPSFFCYVWGYAILNWVFFTCACVILHAVNNAYNTMFTYLGALGTADEVEYENPLPHKKAKAMKIGMQVITLLNAFSFALFVMTFVYNLSIRDAHWATYILVLLPLLVSTVGLLPLSIFRFSLVHAFYEPHQEALDTIWEQYDRLEDDLNYLGRLYERKGCPEITELEAGCSEKKLAKIIRNLGLHISDIRMHRMFTALDTNEDGEVDAQEFWSKLGEARKNLDPSKYLNTPRGGTDSTSSIRR